MDVDCEGFGVASCNKCTIMFYFFQIEDDFEAEAVSIKVVFAPIFDK